MLNKQGSSDDIFRQTDADSSDGFSFESILAEVKGSAFIDGDKKTPSHILEAEAERILREASQISEERSTLEGGAASETAMTAETNMDEPAEFSMPPEFEISKADQTEPPGFFAPPEFTIPEIEEEKSPEVFSPPQTQTAFDKSPYEDSYDSATAMDTGDIFFKSYEAYESLEDEKPKKRQKQAAPISIDYDNSPTIDVSTVSADAESTVNFKGSTNMGTEYGRKTMFDEATVSADEQMGMESDEDDVEIIKEPPLKDAALKFARACNSISLRLIPATIITIIMVLITFTFEAGMIVPFGIGYSLDYAAGTLVICLLAVMILCVEIIIRGVDFIIRGKPNAETLVLFSCAISIISATFTMLSGTALMLPFCAVSALSLLFAAYGERINLRAMTDTLKTAIGSSEPYGVQAEFSGDIDKSVLKKSYCRTDGFYTNLMQQDISEILYQRATPVLLTGVLFLTVLTVIINGAVENSLHVLSALLAAAAPFSALLSYSLPFGIVSKAMRDSGVALGGWGGVDDISFTDGVCITDDDLFPPGTLGLSGVKVYDGAAPNNIICYTASLIIASGSGLTALFSEIIKHQGITPLRVGNFECHESGVSAVIQGHQIASGSAAFMNLIGVRVPDDVNLKNVVFTAVNGKLAGMFAIEYKPLPSVQNALVAMLKWRIDLFFAMRDFNITPSMVGQKFKVPFESFVFIPVKDAYSISDPYAEKQGRTASILIREGFGPFAQSVTGGRLLRFSSLFAAILSVASTLLGVLIMFLMCWDGSFLSATSGNLIIFMFCMLITVLAVCGYVRIRKY
ncbi:MAG: hypothetical protein FWH17_11245 [Oscillospiraceae bacterium]|nr:hypothetical protein [Oscillospiraceae bacterium]